MIRRTLDLPAPFGPTTPIFAPGRKASVTSSRTTLSPWALRTLRMEKTYWAIHPAYGSGRSPMPWRPAPAAGAGRRRAPGGGGRRAAYRSGRGRRRRLPQFGANADFRATGSGHRSSGGACPIEGRLCTVTGRVVSAGWVRRRWWVVVVWLLNDRTVVPVAVDRVWPKSNARESVPVNDG